MNSSLDELSDRGWWPHPFRQFILKIHSRCDLACDYCYVYTMADQRWRSRPKIMSRRIVEETADRVAEHVRSHGLPSVDVILHGGEPLLAGAQRISHCVAAMRAAVGPTAEVQLRLQTNGTLLRRSMLRSLGEWGVRVSVSFDGDRAAQDRHRRRADGTSSYPKVTEALAELAEERNRGIFSGLLCTIDLRNDPIATYQELVSYAPPAVDFLLPHGNWSTPPPGRVVDQPETPYADWLIAVFERWYKAPRKETRVRLFEEIMNLLLGGQSMVEGVGLGPAAMIVVETDGAIEQSDILSSAFSGAAATDLHVSRNSFDEALGLPGVIARQSGAAALSATCHGCHLLRVCGGGLYPHRYRVGSGFVNPSVYCPDLYRLIEHVHDRIVADLDSLRSTQEQSG